MVYRKLGREEEANKAFALSGEIRQRDANESQVRLDCEKKLDQGPREEARAICQRLYDANNAEKLTALGTIYGQHGDLEDALEPLRRAAELEPQSPQMQYNLAFTYYRMNRFAEARAPLAMALERWPDLFPLNALYGAVLVSLGEDREAYPALHRAHELNPQDPPTAELLYRTTLALARKDQSAHEYAQALRYLDEAAALRPNDRQLHLGKAEIYKLMGKTAEAAEELQQAERLKR
jgi:Flp pilus assembly protein TadD